MNTIDLLSLIRQDEMRIIIKRPWSFNSRFWVSLLLGLALVPFVQHFPINILLIVVAFLPLFVSVILQRIKNKIFRIRYPYAFLYLTNFLGSRLTASQQLPLADTFLLSDRDEKLLLSIEEAHKYQQDNSYPINPLLYRRKIYNQESIEKVWDFIMINIRGIEGQDITYTKDQIEMLRDKYKVWSDISKRLLNEKISDILSDKTLDFDYVNQFSEIFQKDLVISNQKATDWNYSDETLNNLTWYNKFVLSPQSAYTWIIRCINMINGDLDENTDYNKKYRRIQKKIISYEMWIIGVLSVILLGSGIAVWIKNSFGVAFFYIAVLGILGSIIFFIWRYFAEKTILRRFTKYPTIMASIATMEGINPETAMNSLSSLEEFDMWKLLLIDKDVFKYPSVIIKPVKDKLLDLINKYPRGTQKALDYLADSPQYKSILVRERTDKKGKHIDFVKAHELLYNMLDIKTFNAVLSLISKEHEIRIYEANFKEAYADDLFIQHVNKVFESATNAYVELMYEWSYEIHTVNYIRHNYDGTNSTVKLNFFEIIYNCIQSRDINEDEIRNMLTTSDRLKHLALRLRYFCDSLDGTPIFVMKDNNEDGEITSIGSMLTKAYEKTEKRFQFNYQVYTNINDIGSETIYMNNPHNYTIISVKDYKLCSQIGWFHKGDEILFVDEEEAEYRYWPDSSKDQLFCEANYISPYSRCLKYHFESLSQKRLCTVAITFMKLKYSRVCSIKEDMKESWHLLNGSIPYFNLYTYIPVSYERKTNFVLTDKEKDNRRKIYQFKDFGIEDRVTTFTTKDVYNDLKLVLSKSFNNLDDAMIFFVPSSEKQDYEKRHRRLSKLLIEDFHMMHSFGLIKYVMDGRSSRDERGAKAPQIIFGECFFKGKQVIIFDDIITSGRTMLHYKTMLESWGAKVIACIALGKTQYGHVSNPIESIKAES